MCGGVGRVVVVGVVAVVVAREAVKIAGGVVARGMRWR